MHMIGYVTLGSNNIPRAAAFYDALLGAMGAKRFMDFDTFIVWATGPGSPGLAIAKPFDGNAATVGNGVMVALNAKKPEQVKVLHLKALALGAKDEGAPGPRGDNFYAGYFRDLDGNKLNFYCFT
jgi:catechol 2,3-dioxygenase-like lactoylglutathione lyase family enzyme